MSNYLIGNLNMFSFYCSMPTSDDGYVWGCGLGMFGHV
jgi:hypothetical protein